jgi:hypothetical protein
MPPGLHPAVAPVGPQFSYVRFPLSAKLGMVHPKYPGETLFLKAHIYKSNTLNGSGYADCDEDHRRDILQGYEADLQALDKSGTASSFDCECATAKTRT